MGFTTDNELVRVDFFKPSGKWYATEAVRMTHWEKSTLIHDAFKKALNDKLYMPKHDCLRFSGMLAVCVEPHHENAHPIMVTIPEKGMFEVRETSSWTEAYSPGDQVEMKFCTSPEEWERCTVVRVDSAVVIVRTAYGDEFGARSEDEIRPLS